MAKSIDNTHVEVTKAELDAIANTAGGLHANDKASRALDCTPRSDRQLTARLFHDDRAEFASRIGTFLESLTKNVRATYQQAREDFDLDEGDTLALAPTEDSIYSFSAAFVLVDDVNDAALFNGAFVGLLGVIQDELAARDYTLLTINLGAFHVSNDRDRYAGWAIGACHVPLFSEALTQVGGALGKPAYWYNIISRSEQEPESKEDALAAILARATRH